MPPLATASHVSNPDLTSLFRTASYLKMGSDPTRVKMLLALAEADTQSLEISERTGISLTAVTSHLTILRAAGIVVSERLGHRVYHCLTARGRKLVEVIGRLTGAQSDDPDPSTN